jgi:uncharacterized protein (TIGR03083 family)
VTLRPDEIAAGFVQEMEGFEELIGSLDAGQWATQTRCVGWTVADVAAHTIGSVADVVGGQVEGLGSPEATAREVAERKGRAPADLVDELAAVSKQAGDLLALFDEAAWDSPAPGGYQGTLAQGVEALFYDTWAHGDDVRHALGQPAAGGPGVRAAVHHLAHVLANQGWGPALLALDGIEEVSIDAPEDGTAGPGATSGSGGDGRITGDALAFILVASGRAEPSTVGLGLDETVNVYR